MVTTCWSCWSATDFGGLLSVIMEPPGSPSWMSSPPDQPLPNSPPLAPLAISGPQQRLGRRIGGGLGAGTRARTHVQVLCKLAMERRRLIVEGVMPPTVCGNQCRDGRRHLVFGRASTRVLWRFGGKLLIRDAGGWFPCGGLAGWWRTVGPVGSRPAGQERCALAGHERSRQARRRPACAVQEPHGPHRVPCSPSAATEPVSP